KVTVQDNPDTHGTEDTPQLLERLHVGGRHLGAEVLLFVDNNRLGKPKSSARRPSKLTHHGGRTSTSISDEEPGWQLDRSFPANDQRRNRVVDQFALEILRSVGRNHHSHPPSVKSSELGQKPHVGFEVRLAFRVHEKPETALDLNIAQPFL